MKYRALVVEDSSDIAESVVDTLESLGHEHDWAKSQEEARQKMDAGGFSYVLLDLQIPVRFGRGLACIEYGEHLAREIHQCPAMQGVPIIVMTAYGKEGFEMAAPLCEHGVVDFINKPFPRTGRTLASVIQGALTRSSKHQPAPKRLTPDKPFQGGEMVLYPDRVELCGVTVVSSGKSSQMWTILGALAQRVEGQRYKAWDGNALAKLVGSDGGQGSVAGSVRDFRRNVAEALGQELGIKVEREDVIETARAGYRLSARIVVKDLRHAAASVRLPAGGEDDDSAKRRDQILSFLRAGERLRVPGLAEKMGCSFTTAKREVDALKAEGQIEFVGAARTGCYQLVGSTHD
jgi:CheY-like chemotaxis protein